MVKDLGAELIDKLGDAHSATHVIASNGKDAIRRTPKLMIAFCRTTNIVSLDWLVKSAAKGIPLSSKGFVVRHTKAERQYNFSMKLTLAKLKERLENEDYLLKDWFAFVCTGVAGNRAPSKTELRLIIEAAGAKWLLSVSARGVDPSHVLIVTSDPETPEQQLTSAAAVKRGAAKRTITWLFNATFTQEVGLLA